jgi:hypothetical protein
MLDELVSTLLYEGYALYPYTPGAAKNATPTPFGTVYPPVYAAECAGAFDHVRLECLAEPGGPGAQLTAELRYLAPSGERHQADEAQLQLGPVPLGRRETMSFDGGRLTVRSESAPDGRALVRACVHNTREVPAGLDRGDALSNSLISTHLVLRLSSGRFISPLETELASVNIWPVLASPTDDTVLGAAIVLPDHPQISPHSRGNLFDNTEIEEALVLHVHALSDGERTQAQTQDPAVRAMLERALATTPEEIVSLHGGLKDVGPRGPDGNPGEERATVDGVTFERGTTLVLRPGTDRDPFDRMLDGRRATIERIYIDYDDRVHLAVTVDDDPGQDLMRETGRYLFFFPHEVQPI